MKHLKLFNEKLYTAFGFRSMEESSELKLGSRKFTPAEIKTIENIGREFEKENIKPYVEMRTDRNDDVISILISYIIDHPDISYTHNFNIVKLRDEYYYVEYDALTKFKDKKRRKPDTYTNDEMDYKCDTDDGIKELISDILSIEN